MSDLNQLEVFPCIRFISIHLFLELFLLRSFFIITSSVESQKGVNPVQKCSAENQKGAIAVKVNGNSALLVLYDDYIYIYIYIFFFFFFTLLILLDINFHQIF